MAHFIILVDDRDHATENSPLPIPDAALRAIGMDLRFRSNTVRVFASPDARILPIPGHGLIIGHVFSRAGRLLDSLELTHPEQSLTPHLLENFWGEYLAIDFSGGSTHAFGVLRDPSGGIPCLYAFADRAGFITSDIATAANLGLYNSQVDWTTIAHGLCFPYLRTERTALLGISELLPGNLLTFENGHPSVRVAWSPWRFLEKGIRHRDLRAAAKEVRGAVSTAVRALAALDREIVLELSGGLDSSIVAAALRGTAARVAYCTLVIPGGGVDERQYAVLMTNSAGEELKVVEVRAEDARFCFPANSQSAVPSIGILQNSVNEVWTSAGTKLGAQSFFSGGGGDSVFCYLKNAIPAVDAYMERGIVACLTAIGDLSKLHQCTFWKAGRLTLKKLAQKRRQTWKLDSSFINASKILKCPERHPWLEIPMHTLPGDCQKVFELIGTQIFRDAAPRGEQRPMRLPLLSQPVVEACLKVPTWMWIAGGQNRAVARTAFADVLPDEILNRRSKGTYTGYMSAIYTRNKVKMRQFLKDGQLTSHDLLDWHALDAFFDAELAPRDLSFVRIFDLCMVENWIQGCDPRQ